jgi:polyphosphate kinase 2 (PPK2 family)
MTSRSWRQGTAHQSLKADLKRLGDLQHLLYATIAPLLIVLQAMDTGKDGTIETSCPGPTPSVVS